MAIIKAAEHSEWKERQRLVSLSNGMTVSYMEAGNTEGAPLVLLHGFGNSGRNWQYTFRFLEKKYHIYAIDEIGAGQSSCPDRFSFPIALQAENVIELMDILGIKRAYLAGHSIGSYICQAIAFMIPDRIIKAVLVSTFARMNESQADIARSAQFYRNINDNRPDENWYSERAGYPDQEGLEYQLKDLQTLPAGYFGPTWWGMTMTDHRNFLQFIEAPVMAIWGEKDMGLPEHYRKEFMEIMPDAEVRIYEGLGHEIVSRAPEQLCKDMLEFFEE
ncbi:MAG: alpha/beta hydrolase [Clostridiales bacterium]|nr:alpha/beta hydrolase [Candidatus Crickella merdequi]